MASSSSAAASPTAPGSGTTLVATAPDALSTSDATASLRVGWMIAEVRGRFRPDGPKPGSHAPAHNLAQLDDTTMLLAAADERTPVERQVESVKVLAAIATTEVTGKITYDNLSQTAKYDHGTDLKGKNATYVLAYLACRVIWSRIEVDLSPTFGLDPIAAGTSKDPNEWWTQMAWFLWAWDEAIQDKLAGGTFGTASAYQLGRGLSETYWSLNPEDRRPTSPHSWTFLLGRNRATAFEVLCRRLQSTFGKLCMTAVSASVNSWADVAADVEHYIGPQEKLAEQSVMWRDLLLTGQDPVDLVETKQLQKAIRQIRPVFDAFRWEIVIGLVFAAVLGYCVYYLSSAPKTILTIVSALGITATAIAARAKAIVSSLSTRIQEALYQSSVSAAVTKTPQKTQQQQLMTGRAAPDWKALEPQLVEQIPAAASNPLAPAAQPGVHPAGHPPGWYDDPTDNTLRRFWDGAHWTQAARWDGTQWSPVDP